MWLSRVFRSFRGRQHGKKQKACVVKQRRLFLEPLEERRLLSVLVQGTIVVSNLPCAAPGA
jgi:hypothetical protein